MSPIERQLTLVIDARRRDMARAFVALFVALSLVFGLAAGVIGPVQVVMAASGTPEASDMVEFPGPGPTPGSKFTIRFYGVEYDHGNGTSTWTYSVTYHGGAPGLSHLNVLVCEDLNRGHVLDQDADFDFAPEFGDDGSAGTYGIKYDEIEEEELDQNQELFFHFTLNGLYAADPDGGVVVKAGNEAAGGGHRIARVPSPACEHVLPTPDLSVTKKLFEPKPGPATVGSPVIFKISVKNTGEVALQDVQVTDTFDTAYLQFVGIDEVNDEQVNGSEISWTIPGLAKGASVTYTARFIAKAATGPEGTTNRVKVEAGDLVDEADDTVEIVEGEPGPEPEPKADLVISKYGENNDELLAGAAFRITGDGVKIDIEDNQDNEDGKDWDPEPGVIRVKGLQPGQYQVQETRAPTGYRINPEPEKVDVTCDQPVEPTLLVHDAEDSPCGEAVVVFFNEREDDDTPPPSRTPRNPRVDLSVTKTVDDPTPDEGQLVTFTVTVTNEGPDDASGVVVSDILPAGLEYVSHSASQGSYDPASGQWVVGNLADDASATLTVFAAVGEGTAGRTLVNTARIISSSPDDRNLSNNTATAEVTPPEPILIEEEPPLAEPPADPPLPVTGGSMALLLIPGITLLGAGLYVRRRYLR